MSIDFAMHVSCCLPNSAEVNIHYSIIIVIVVLPLLCLLVASELNAIKDRLRKTQNTYNNWQQQKLNHCRKTPKIRFVFLFGWQKNGFEREVICLTVSSVARFSLGECWVFRGKENLFFSIIFIFRKCQFLFHISG